MTKGADWTDECALGIPEMDAQHRAIFDWLAKLLEAAEREETPSDLIREGRRHSAYHFGAEENFLTDIGFPGLAKQRVQHRQFLARLDNILIQIREQGEQLSVEQAHELQSWLMGHILGLDREYAEFLADRDTEPPDPIPRSDRSRP